MYQIIRTDKLCNVSCLIFEQSNLGIVIFETVELYGRENNAEILTIT